jgi:hypothetical protein
MSLGKSPPWEAHVANRKAAWYKFLNALDLKQFAMIPGFRNAGIPGRRPRPGLRGVVGLEEFMNVLASKGVRVKNAFPGRTVDATLPNLLDLAERSGAVAVLYVFIHFQGMENMRVECYSVGGKKLWEEKVLASLGLSPAGMTEGFVRRMKKKLESHVGEPCPPVQAAGADPHL